MGALMRHRGVPGGVARAEEGVGLGWCHAPPEPGRAKDGEIIARASPAQGDACVLDGYLLNADDLRAELTREGLAPRSDAHAEIVACAFARWGADAFARLDGAFAAALVAGDTLWLVRDPIGEKVLYWTEVAGTFLFASEAKAFLAHPGFRAEPDPASLVKLLVFSFVPGAPSAFRGVSELPPAHRLSRRTGGAPRVERYWDLVEDVQPWSEEESAERTGALVRAAVKRRLPPGSGPVGAFLSGGVDSSAVVAVLAELGVPVTAWSLAFGEGHENELDYARLVVERTGVPHRLVDIGSDAFVDLLPAVIWHLDDPLCDCITVPNYLLAREAAREVRVIFNGEGGDPLFGGPKNKFLILGEWYRFLGGYDRARAYLGSYHKFWEHLDDALTPELLGAAGGRAALEELVRPYLESERMHAFLNKLMYVNVTLKGGQNILVKVDKMLAASGVQPRSPLFDRTLAEATFRMPTGHKRKGEVEKWCFKRAVEPLLPRAVVYRKKAGMGVPLNVWFREGRLRAYARDLLLSPRALGRGYFRRGFVETLMDDERWRAGKVGKDRSGELLWMLLALELWHRIYVEGEWRRAA
jgi:asparagine synthase (glutamine-hydrolysing)